MFLRANNNRPVVWQSLEAELGPFRKYFKGKVLNAGAGNRDISNIIEGELVNLDIPDGSHNSNIHIAAPLEKIPVEKEIFDVIICNAVLEHVEDVDSVMREFYRVLKPGGYLYIGVPFMQPEHKDPKDFRRYTADGLAQLLEKHSFNIIEIRSIHSVYHTMGWIVHNWLTSEKKFSYWLLRQIIYPVLRYKTRTSKTNIDSISSAFGAIAKKKENVVVRS